LASRSPRTLGSRWYLRSAATSSSPSVTASPAAGPSAIDTATARFSSTIGERVNATRSPYKEAMRTQSVSSARGALAWQAAIFAWIA
jgi:hypothetical protein